MRTMQIINAAQATEQDIEAGNIAASLKEAEALAPWAAEVIEIEGGWVAFESVEDADTFRSQA